MSYKAKAYTLVSNMLSCVKNTMEYTPALLIWVALCILVKVAIPVLEMYIPKIVIAEITGGKSWQSLAIVVLSITLPLALLSGFSKLCERYIYHKKILMGSYYIHKISQKGLTTDYANRETESFVHCSRKATRCVKATSPPYEMCTMFG